MLQNMTQHFEKYCLENNDYIVVSFGVLATIKVLDHYPKLEIPGQIEKNCLGFSKIWSEGNK